MVGFRHVLVGMNSPKYERNLSAEWGEDLIGARIGLAGWLACWLAAG